MDGPLNGTAIAAREVTVVRGGRLVLDVPWFAVPRGEVLALIGPNGAGKSTLLLTLALLQRPTRGEVFFYGEPVRGRELALRRRMAVVFQEPLLLDRSVRANVETGLRLRGVPARERGERAARWLQRFGVGALGGRSPRTLSGGEAQRVSLARAFALEPEVLFLDEPFSALDQQTREALQDDLAHALAQTGTTTLLITHDRDEAARLGAGVAVMLGGRIRQLGTPSEVFGAPVDSDVAAFVGVETIVEGRVTERDAGIVTLDVAGHAIDALDDGRSFATALVCLRPEDVSVTLAEGPASSARNHLHGFVSRVVPTGVDVRLEIDCGFAITARITRRSAEELALGPGTAVVATFKATAVHLIPRGG